MPTLPIFVHSTIDDMTNPTPNALRVYMHLARRAGRDGVAYPSYQSVGDHCFSSVSKNAATRKSFARRAIGELLDAGLITKQVAFDDAGDYSSNRYRIEPNPKPAGGVSIDTGMPIDTGYAYRHTGVPIGTKGSPSEDTPVEEEANVVASEPTPEPTPEPTAPAAAAKSQPTRDAWIVEYENTWGMMVASPYIAEQIIDWQSRVTFPAWQHALRESTRANARNWRYLSRVLERLERDGYQEPQATPTATTTIDIDLELPL